MCEVEAFGGEDVCWGGGGASGIGERVIADVAFEAEEEDG